MQNRSAKTRTQIKQAAINEFGQYGYDAAAVSDICKLAGVSKGAFYHHFTSKQALFLSIMQDWLDGIDERLFISQTPNQSVAENIQKMGNTMGFVFKAASGQLPMFLEFMIQASRDEEIWNAVIAPYKRYQQFFTSMIEEGKKDGSFKPNVNSHEAAQVLISLAIGVLLQGVVNPTTADWEKVTNKGVKMIIEGLNNNRSE